MKKSKLFVLLPMMALLLSGCQTEVVPSDAPSESTSEESSPSESSSEETSSGEYTPTVTYSVSITNSNEIASLTVGDSVVVAVSLITTTDGVDERVNGTASEVTLSCDDPSVIGIEGLRITALNEGSTSIYASWTERGVTSSSVAVDVSKEEVVEPPVTHEYTYGVSITNGSELSSLTEGDTKTVSVSLITYEDGVETTSVLATSDNVTLSSSATDVVSVSGLELTALSKGTSNISAKWDEHNVSSNAVTVSVSEKVTEEGGEGGDTGSTEEPEYQPTITYKLEITNADEIREIQTGDTRLVEVTGYTYEDDIQTDATKLTSENVTLISSDPDYLSVDGLTITAEAAKEAIALTARSETYGTAVAYISVTANPDEEIVEDVYTYDLSVNNQQELQNLAYGYGYETPTSVTLDITLITYINGEFAYSQKADTTMTDLEVISWNSSIVTTSGLTVTAVSEGSTVVEVKWYDHPLNGGGEGFSDLSFFVNVEVTEYFEPFTAISKIGFSQDSYTFVFNDDADPIALEVSYEPCDATNPSYTVFSDDDSIAKVEYCETTQNYILSPVAEGETDIHVVATDTETNPAAGTSHVVVEVARNPILSFGTSTMNIELEVGSSATIGYAPTESGSTGPDVEVYVNPDEPDNKAFTLSGDYDSEFLSISDRDETNGLNTYTISALDGENAGKASHTYTLDITADDEYSDASTRIYVTILTDDAKARPVEGISLSVPYVTIANNGSFTISNGDTTDVTVTVYGGDDGVYEDGWNLIDYDSTLLDVDFDFETSVFTISAKEPDINQTVTTNLVFRTMGAPVKEARLAVYILRAEDYTTDINVSISSVSMLTDQTIVLGEDDNYSDFSVSIYNQYNEVLEGANWEASIDTEASGLGVLESVSRVDGAADRLAITSGSKTGTGVIRISAEDDESIYTDISVSVSQQYYEVEQISCSLGTINLGYDLANDPKGASTYIQDSAISYYSSKGPVNPEYEGFSLEYAGSYLSIGEDNRTITALLPTGDAGVNITVRSTTNANATTTINVVVNDVTDYAVKTLTVNPTSIDVSVSGSQDNAPTDLAALGVTVSMSPEYATNTDYSVTSSDSSLVSVDGNNNITVKASKEDGSATLYIVASDNTYGANATLTINVKTTYVKADSITVNYSNTALTTGDVVDFDTNSYVVVGNSASGTVTDSTYTIESSNSSVLSVAGHVVTAAGAGSATLTFTTADGATETLTITVTDPRTEAKNVTVYFRLTDSTNSGTTYTCPEYADIYCQGNFSTGNDTWDDAFALTAETDNSVTYYKATISTILLDTEISYRIIFTYSGDDLNWNHQSDTLTFKIVDADVADGGNLKLDATIGNPEDIIPKKDESLSQFSVTIATKGTSSNSSVVNFSVVSDLNGWPTNGGDAMTKVSGNSQYDQYITYDWERDANFKIYFGGCSSDKTVWWDWNYCWTSNYNPSWEENTAYCWTSEPQFCFDLTGYSGKLDSYSNLTIVFTVNYSNCTSSVKSHSCITGITTYLS